MANEADNRALSHLRVLDLTDDKGVYCAKLLADLGADTVKIEPPGGHPTRRIGPFVDNLPHPERSLHWFHYNTNKRSVTLDITQPEGQKLFKRLAQQADVVVESFQPGYLDSLGLGYESLREVDRGVVLTSVTGFGQTGPYKDYLSSDLVAWAMSGFMYTNGYPWTPPLRSWGNQAYHAGCSYGAIGTLAAVHSRRFTGEGQHVDVSLQEAVCAISEHFNMYYIHDKVVHKRRPNEHTHGAGSFRRFRCKDGWIEMTVGFGDRFNALAAWMAEEGMAENLTDPQWQEAAYHKKHITEAYPIVERWTLTRGKEELYHAAQARHLPYGAVRTIPEVLADENFQARGFFVPVEHPELNRTLTYSGAPYKMMGSPWSIRRRAPLIGEHNEEIYAGELGLSKDDLVILKEAGVI